MKNFGFSAIDLLIGLLITSACVLLIFKNLYATKTINTITTDKVQEHVEKTINEIEQMRQETINYNNEILDINF